MLERMTVEIPIEFKEALRTERFERRTTYREIIVAMFAERYGAKATPKPRKGKKTDGTPTGA